MEQWPTTPLRPPRAPRGPTTRGAPALLLPAAPLWPAAVAARPADGRKGERKRAFGGHSLRAGLASSAQIEEALLQKHLGHASAEMTRRCQRKRDRFKVNLTKAAGL
jgi:integrase